MYPDLFANRGSYTDLKPHLYARGNMRLSVSKEQSYWAATPYLLRFLLPDDKEPQHP
jgi:hypothetical protein